jgi:DNA polymerase III subunit delta'
MKPDMIAGHADQLAQLTRDLEAGNVAHAYLFAGPPNVGKTAVARWFATELLKAEVSPENRDETARRAAHLLHPDVLVLDQLWIEDQCEDWDEIAKSSNIPQRHRSKPPKVMRTDVIGIDDVRLIQDRLHETGETRRRVCVIRSVERMRDEAANAFLKMLEEPPPGRVFLLTTESLSSLLPTITSRTRVLHFSPLPPSAMRPLLAGLDEDDARFILRVAQGAPGKAVTLARDPDALRHEKTVHQDAVAFWDAQSAFERMKYLAPLHERGEDGDRLLLHLALALRDRRPQRPERVKALMEMCRALETNAHRQLIAQRFALAVEG